jgi:Cu/Ag efflux protein CusF
MNKKVLMGILGLAVSLMFTSGLMAQEKASTAAAASAASAPAQEMKVEKFNGVIENVDMAKKDVVVEYHKDKMNFSVGDKTKVFEGKKELKLSDLTKGLWASVEYNKEGNQFLAQTIHVSPSKKEEPMASSVKTSGEQMKSNEKAPETK